jgi:hypothetical protein
MENNNINYLIIEKIDKLSFPKEIESLVSKIDWNEQRWVSIGLPRNNCKYCISNDFLYFEQDELGEINLQKTEFTGEVFFCTTIINPEKGEDNYIISFEALFFKGMLSETSLKDFSVQTYEEYEKGFDEYCKTVDKKEKIKRSFWYKFIYIPYYNIVKHVFLIVSWLLNKLIKIVIKTFYILTPIDPL